MSDGSDLEKGPHQEMLFERKWLFPLIALLSFCFLGSGTYSWWSSKQSDMTRTWRVMSSLPPASQSVINSLNLKVSKAATELMTHRIRERGSFSTQHQHQLIADITVTTHFLSHSWMSQMTHSVPSCVVAELQSFLFNVTSRLATGRQAIKWTLGIGYCWRLGGG